MIPPASAQLNRLFTHCLELLECSSTAVFPELSDAQNALLIYLRMDKVAEDEGFAALIAQGWGETVLSGTLAATLRQWQIAQLPDILAAAQLLYRQHGRAILERAADGQPALCAAFPQFAAVDEAYFMACEDIFPEIYNYVRRHYADFVALLDHQAG